MPRPRMFRLNGKVTYYQRKPDRQRSILFHSARTRARSKGLEFTIEPEDIVIPTHCPLLGCELTYIRENGRQQTNASIDRVDSTKGYIKGNVWVISDLVEHNEAERNERTANSVCSWRAAPVRFEESVS